MFENIDGYNTLILNIGDEYQDSIYGKGRVISKIMDFYEIYFQNHDKIRIIPKISRNEEERVAKNKYASEEYSYFNSNINFSKYSSKKYYEGFLDELKKCFKKNRIKINHNLWNLDKKKIEKIILGYSCDLKQLMYTAIKNEQGKIKRYISKLNIKIFCSKHENDFNSEMRQIELFKENNKYYKEYIAIEFYCEGHYLYKFIKKDDVKYVLRRDININEEKCKETFRHLFTLSDNSRYDYLNNITYGDDIYKVRELYSILQMHHNIYAHYEIQKRLQKRIQEVINIIKNSFEIKELLFDDNLPDFLKQINEFGCTFQEFKIHFERLFNEGMTWSNYGKWHVDHIKPCFLFDLSDYRQQKECFNLSNFQPLWGIDNKNKGTTYYGNDIDILYNKLDEIFFKEHPNTFFYCVYYGEEYFFTNLYNMHDKDFEKYMKKHEHEPG